MDVEVVKKGKNSAMNSYPKTIGNQYVNLFLFRW